MDGQISIGEYIVAESLSSVISAVDTIQLMMGKAWEMMLANSVLRVSVAAGLLSVGIGVFAYLRRAARH